MKMGDKPVTSNLTSRASTPECRALGQYFTPDSVVAICFRLLRHFDPGTERPFVLDPACGEGAFLSYALKDEITTPDRLFGMEKDARLVVAWESAGLLGKANLSVTDALLSDPHASSHLPSLACRESSGWRLAIESERSPGADFPLLAADTSRSPCFPPAGWDWVVGNPPFGTQNLRGYEDADLEALSNRYSIYRTQRFRSHLARYPVEILFLERFVQLTRPGGFVAIVVPDGILANARLSGIREWIWEHAQIKAVVSLPRHVFVRYGAAAKTSILLLRKRSKYGLPRTPEAVKVWEYGKLAHVPAQALIHLTSPSDRLDPAYYDAAYARNEVFLRSLPHVVEFGDLIEYTTYGQVGHREFSESGVRYLTPANLKPDADGLVPRVSLSPERFVTPDSWNDPPRSRLKRGDLLFSNSGVGCIGRTAVFYLDEPANVSQHLNVIRVRAVQPEYLAVYLQTKFARLQIEREKCGVGPSGLNFNRIRRIHIPILDEETRSTIADHYSIVAHTDCTLSIRPLVSYLEERLEAAQR